MNKRVMALLLTFCMLFALLPATAALATATPYQLWVNNQQLTSEALTVQCGGGTAIYDPAENTLTLNNAQITEGCLPDQWMNSGIISYLPDLEIVLVGDNFITNTGGEGVSTYETVPGDWKTIRHDLTVSSSTGGTLMIEEDAQYSGYGINCTGDLTLDGVTLDIDSAATGLWAEWRLDIIDCDIEIDVHSGYYGMLTNVGGSAADSGGTGCITVTDSTVDIDSTSPPNQFGVVTDSAVLVGGSTAVGELEINSSTLKLRSGGHVIQGAVDTDDPADGIPDLIGVITINGGTVDMATSGSGVQAVAIPAANVTLNNGVAIVRGALDGMDCFISQRYAVAVNGSYAAGSGAGSYTPGATVTINAGARNNYAFTGWTTASSGVTLASETNVATTFEMPANAVTVTANWSYAGGGDYKALFKLATGEVFRCYDIYLKSGKKNSGSAMYLTFDLNARCAGQGFTLLHKKADGAVESFTAIADENGDLTFGPLYELSPFMLVKGTQGGRPGMPDTGDSPVWLLALCALLTGGVVVTAKKRRCK